MCNQTYVAKFGMYNRCFGESPNWTEAIEAPDLNAAKKVADDLRKKSGPDTYVVDVTLKTN